MRKYVETNPLAKGIATFSLKVYNFVFLLKLTRLLRVFLEEKGILEK